MFQKRNSLGGCLYFLAVLYLDCIDFGERYIDQAIPRIAVWKKGMITTFSELDQIDENNFGLRLVKDLSTICYYKVTSMHIPIQFHFEISLSLLLGVCFQTSFRTISVICLLLIVQQITSLIASLFKILLSQFC